MDAIRKSVLCVGIGLALAGCATQPKEGRTLVPPAGVAREQTDFHISQCVAEARLAANTPLTDQDKAPLQSRSTVEFIVRGRPVVNAEYLPTMYSGSLSTMLVPGSYGPAAVSDRYVLCLLHRGYTWPNAPATK